MTEGWHYSPDSRVRDLDGKATGEMNVMARFDDHDVIDGAKSRAVRKNVYRVAIICKTKVDLNVAGGPSSDASSHVLKFDAYPNEAEDLLKRFPEAWKAYLKRRKAPEQPGETDFYEDRMIPADMLPKKPRKTKEAA